MKSILLPESVKEIEFCTPARRSRLTRVSGLEVHGNWGADEGVLSAYPHRQVPLLCDYLNWPGSKQDVLRFARLYGPMENRFDPARKFRFSISAWLKQRESFRKLCDDITQDPGFFEFGHSLGTGTISVEAGKLRLLCDALML